MIYPNYVYIIQCKDPTKYYIGSTYRSWGARLQEHKDGYGSAFTRKYGFGKLVKRIECPLLKLQELENQLWMYYARHVCGPENVRGGDVTIGTEPLPAWLLPEEFGGERIVDWGVNVP